MKKFIGNIVSNQSLKAHELINVVNDISLVDTSLPTLIVGWGLVKTFFPFHTNILSNQINHNTKWTFSKREDVDKSQNDIILFNKELIKNLKEINEYIFFNVLSYKLGKIKNFLFFLKNKDEKTIYIKNNFLYIYCNQKTIGVDISALEYIGIEKEKVINKINSYGFKVIDNDNFLSFRLKKIIENNDYLIPYLFNIKYKGL